MVRTHWVGLGVALGLGCLLGPVACSAPNKGALVLAISTDMRTPKDVNVVSVFITTDGVSKFDYLGRVLPDGSVALPATLAIVEPDEPNAKVRIRVTAFEDQNARVLRDVVTTVPHQATSLLRLPLNFLDDGSGTGQIPMSLLPRTGLVPDGDTVFDATALKSLCDFDTTGKTSVNGQCVPALVDSAKLPAYVESAVFGDAGLTSSGTPASCFDVASCFRGATEVTAIDMQGCTATLPEGVNATSLNLALVTLMTGECITPGQCYVPLESDATEGFSVTGNTVHMIPGVCAKVSAGARLFAASGACAPKALSAPVCEPTTGSVGAEAGADAGAATCDGSYVLSCVGGGQCTGGIATLTVTGSTAVIDIPMDNGNGVSVVTPVQATVDPASCTATLVLPRSDSGSCDPGGTVTIDLSGAVPTQVPCGSGSADGKCTTTMLTCSLSRGTADAGKFDGGAFPDATTSADAGGGGSGSASVAGTVSGISLTAVEASAAVGVITTASSSQNAVMAILISDTPGECALQRVALAGSGQRAGSTQLAFAIEQSGAAPIGPGVYGINTTTASPDTLGPGQTWDFASLTQTTAACTFAPSSVTGGLPDSQPIGGSVTITQVMDASVSGTFNLTFSSGDLSGSFVAPTCSLPNLQQLFTTNAVTLGETGPDSNGICYGFWGGTSDAGAPDAGPPPDDGSISIDTGPTDGGVAFDGGPSGDTGVALGCYPLPFGAVSWWRGEGDATDVLGLNPATWTGPASYAAGEVGNGFLFGGASFLSAGIAGVNFSGGGTVEGWVQVDSVPAMMADLFGFASSLQVMDAGGLVANGLGATWDPEFDLAGQSVAGASYSTGGWLHVAVVSTPIGDGGSSMMELYLDGNLYMQGPVSLADAAAASTFLMGGEGSGTSDLMGVVDEVTIYNVALTPAQIQAIFSAGTAGKCQCMVATDCPVGTPTCVSGFCHP